MSNCTGFRWSSSQTQTFPSCCCFQCSPNIVCSAGSDEIGLVGLDGVLFVGGENLGHFLIGNDWKAVLGETGGGGRLLGSVALFWGRGFYLTLFDFLWCFGFSLSGSTGYLTIKVFLTCCLHTLIKASLRSSKVGLHAHNQPLFSAFLVITKNFKTNFYKEFG